MSDPRGQRPLSCGDTAGAVSGLIIASYTGPPGKGWIWPTGWYPHERYACCGAGASGRTSSVIRSSESPVVR
jgi:hypothetical protein